MGCLGRLAGPRLAAILIALLGPASAVAGAWTRTPGEGLLIATAGRRAAPVGALTGGPVETDANISQLYAEYGLIEGLTVGAKLYLELSVSEFEASQALLGGFIRKRLWQDGQGGVASVQIGYAHPIEEWVGNGLEIADPGAVPEAHLSGLYGRGWAGDWGNAFLSTGVGYHWRGEGLADEIRAELTGGFAPWRGWMGILSLYGLHPLGPGTDASLKLAPSVAYIFPPGEEDDAPPPRTVQLGVSYDLLNRDDGLGVLLSVWQPF